jgi:cob(I)alamin adenosyltransferase
LACICLSPLRKALESFSPLHFGVRYFYNQNKSFSMKIYTKTGDEGKTGLFGGKRVSKSDLRVDAYGTVDELNAQLGLLRDQITNEPLFSLLKEIQDRLFTIGSNLASDPEKSQLLPDIHAIDINILEAEMDKMDADLVPLRHFILPGGHTVVSYTHVCRTVCRRAERMVVALHEIEPVELLVLQYLNRLSDYFFVLGRFLAHEMGVEEVKWVPRK